MVAFVCLFNHLCENLNRGYDDIIDRKLSAYCLNSSPFAFLACTSGGQTCLPVVVVVVLFTRKANASYLDEVPSSRARCQSARRPVVSAGCVDDDVFQCP